MSLDKIPSCLVPCRGTPSEHVFFIKAGRQMLECLGLLSLCFCIRAYVKVLFWYHDRGRFLYAVRYSAIQIDSLTSNSSSFAEKPAASVWARQSVSAVRYGRK